MPCSNKSRAELSGVLRCVATNKFLKMGRDIADLRIAATLYLAGNIFGDVFGPALFRVDRGDFDGPAILAADQILNDRLEVGAFQIRLGPGASRASKTRLRGQRLTHKQLHATEPGLNGTRTDSFRQVPGRLTTQPFFETCAAILAFRNMQRIYLVRVMTDSGGRQIWLAATGRDEAVDRVLEVVPEGWSASLVGRELAGAEATALNMQPGEVRQHQLS